MFGGSQQSLNDHRGVVRVWQILLGELWFLRGGGPATRPLVSLVGDNAGPCGHKAAAKSYWYKHPYKNNMISSSQILQPHQLCPAIIIRAFLDFLGQVRTFLYLIQFTQLS